MRPFYRKDLFRDEIIKITPKELVVKIDQGDKKLSTLKMEKGQTITLNSDNYEVGIVILSGTATVLAGEFKAENKGKRKDVFSGKPAAIYIPRDTEYTIIATGYGLLEVALCMVKTQNSSKPFVIDDEEVEVKQKGVFNWKREVHEILIPSKISGTCRLAIGETYGCPGVWATYPYTEDDSEVAFLFKFSSYATKTIQVMGSEGATNEFIVGNDTALVVDKGYLPVAEAHAKQVYTLWFKIVN